MRDQCLGKRLSGCGFEKRDLFSFKSAFLVAIRAIACTL